MPRLTRCDVYGLCNEHHWFSNGCNSQYDRMFDMVQDCKPIHDIAVAIWICSDPIWTVEAIEAELAKVAITDA